MVDQIGKMADEIWKVMLGLADPKDFIRNLASMLTIPSEKASAIASDVNAQMFQPVRESLRRIYDAQPSAPSTPAARADSHVPPMIYPQDKFEEEFKKEPAEQNMSDTKGRTEETLEQLAPLAPSVVKGSPPAVIPPDVGTMAGKPSIPLSDDFTYPEKTKEVHRESAASQGVYKGRDPYREAVE